MELTHDFTVPADVETTWATFMDLEAVGGCFPGATVTSVTDDGFAGTVKVKLGPIALTYKGEGRFLSRDDAEKKAVIEAKGKDQRGNGTAGATVTVHVTPSGSGSRVDVTTDLAITGKPAQFGRGVMQDVSDKLLQQFVGCIEGRLASVGPVETSDAVGAAESASGTGAGEAEAATPSPAPAASSVAAAPTYRPATAAASGSDDAIDLGATVLPVLVRQYAPAAIAGLLGLLIGWLLRGRRA